MNKIRNLATVNTIQVDKRKNLMRCDEFKNDIVLRESHCDIKLREPHCDYLRVLFMELFQWKFKGELFQLVDRKRAFMTQNISLRFYKAIIERHRII